ncbi:hypothetical protein FB562_1975 [Homoserinimonas aerilata]|uniref:DUF559 domain-containing protein n=1 Tax=Homoserinimonas aerilata TaxID=1162970 RepID=A0A542YLB9_9MICO|nr:hypothetical protein FB562_1975 [Homoserinimonas aerilata]
MPLPPQLRSAPFAVGVGRTHGLGAGRMRGPDLLSPFRGVRVASEARTLHELCLVYAQRMPPHAFFSGITAAVIMGIPLPHHLERSRLLHVAVPAPHRAVRGRGIRGSTVRLGADDIREWRGLRISSPSRVWCELAQVLSVPDLVAAGDFLIQWRLPSTTKEALARAVDEYAGRRGRPAMREAIGHLDDRSESRPESIVRVALAGGGVDGFIPNQWVTTSGGHRCRIDLAIPGRKLAIEYQGEHHNDSKQFHDDMTRRSRLEADGWAVMFIGAGDLDDPAELLQRIRRMLDSRPHAR